MKKVEKPGTPFSTSIATITSTNPITINKSGQKRRIRNESKPFILNEL
jgi:hypothetical protein